MTPEELARAYTNKRLMGEPSSIEREMYRAYLMGYAAAPNAAAELLKGVLAEAGWLSYDLASRIVSHLGADAP